MKDYDETKFMYNVIFRNDNNLPLKITELFSGTIELSLVSRDFDDYLEALTSCKVLMDTLAMDLMAASGKTFVIGVESNPEISNTPSVSVDWKKNELGRLWLYEKGSETTGSQVQAAGQASLYVIEDL